MSRPLNYKHLHYFWAVARWGGLTRAAERLHLSPQTLSGQIRQLEHATGTALFRAAGKRLELTEAGRLAFSYADEMFSLGAELGERLRALPGAAFSVFRVGVADAVPKWLAQRLLAPALALDPPQRLVCHEGALEPLLADLALHRLDFVLSTRPAPAGLNVRCYRHRLGEDGIGLYRARAAVEPGEPFPQSLHGRPWLLPGTDSPLRAQLLEWCEARRIVPRVVGDFDDSALMKAFGAAGAGIFPAPLAAHAEIERAYDAVLLGAVDGVREAYFALSGERRVTHPGVRAIIEAAPEVLAGGGPVRSSEKPKKNR